MQFNDRQRRILVGVFQDQERLAAMPRGDDQSMSRDALGRHRLRIRQAREGMVPMALEDWLGHAPSNSDHVLCHREYQRLEGMGLLLRCNPFGGHRTTHLKLTPAGRRVAERLLAEEYGQDADGIDETIDWSNVELLPIELPSEPETIEHDAQ
jgi:hypothetical protein